LLQASGRSIPTVFISTHDDENYREMTRSARAVVFLTKPCHEELLRGTIYQVLAS